jgi:hypothetical protein
MRPNPLMAMVVMTLFRNADAALPPDGGIVHAKCEASIFGAKTMEIRQSSGISRKKSGSSISEDPLA